MAELKQNIMRRVYAIYALRAVAPKVVVLALALTLLKYFVSFVDVFRNMPSFADLSHSFAFWVNAFIGTDVIVQTSIVATLLALAYMARDIVTNVRLLTLSR